MESKKIGWISTWNSRCGIACDNSKGLIGNKQDQVIILAPDDEKTEFEDADNVRRCWSLNNFNYNKLIATIKNENIDDILIQFNMGFFDYKDFTKAIKELHNIGKRIYIILHATREDVVPEKKVSLLKDILKLCERVFVHTPIDIERLENIGVIDNVELFPLGMYQPKEIGEKSSIEFDKTAYNISSYGFFLPNKGLLELLAAVNMLLREGRNVRLALVNAEYNHPVSKDLIKKAQEFIEENHIQDKVILHTEFMSDEEKILAILRETDLVVFPYQKGDSSSGAARMGLNSGALTMCSSHSIFDDIRDLIVTIPWDAPVDIANSIAEVMDNTEYEETQEYEEKIKATKKWCDERRFPDLSDRLFSTIQKNIKDKA